MNKSDYVSKLQNMIDDGIKNGTYLETTHKFLNVFKISYTGILKESIQPAKLYGTAKTHKFNNVYDITVELLKFT